MIFIRLDILECALKRGLRLAMPIWQDLEIFSKKMILITLA